MFPKGARFSRFTRSADGKPRWVRRSFHNEAKFMANTVPGFTRSFLVQKTDDDGNDKGVIKIDQYINPKDGKRGQERVRNQVEAQCYHNWRKTGIHHHVIFEGDPWQASELIAGRDGIPF